jgi:hypothetical protein
MRRDDIPHEEDGRDPSEAREADEDRGTEEEHDVPEDQLAMEPEVGSTG